jgi:hypothetical protein
MRARRQDETFRAAERVLTRQRMRRLRAALRKAELAKNKSPGRTGPFVEHQAVQP